MNKKSFIITLSFLLISLFIASCREKNVDTKTNVKTETDKVAYSCPMHPEVISDKTGKCPKCGMELVIKK